MRTGEMAHRELFIRMLGAIEKSEQTAGSMTTAERRGNTAELHACIAEIGGRFLQMLGSIADASNTYTSEMKRQREEREATRTRGYTGRSDHRR